MRNNIARVKWLSQLKFDEKFLEISIITTEGC